MYHHVEAVHDSRLLWSGFFRHTVPVLAIGGLYTLFYPRITEPAVLARGYAQDFYTYNTRPDYVCSVSPCNARRGYGTSVFPRHSRMSHVLCILLQNDSLGGHYLDDQYASWYGKVILLLKRRGCLGYRTRDSMIPEPSARLMGMDPIARCPDNISSAADRA